MFTLQAQMEAEEATLLGQWSKEGLVGSSAYSNIYNEVWGLAYEEREYAVVGSTAGTHFIDVTDPANLVEVDFIAGASAGAHIIHRDYHSIGCHLYAVADEGNGSTLQIIDISYLPDSVSVVYDTNETLKQAHNIFIDVTLEKLYCFAASGGEHGNSALRIYDISDPVQPEYIAEYNSFADISAGHVHDGYVDNGLAYLNCGNDGFAMVDFTDPLNPQTLGTMTQYPFSGYNHSGWPSDDGQYFFLGDENHGYPVKVIDVSDVEDIHSVGTLESGQDNIGVTIPHNQIVACDYLYVSYYYDGLQVYDVSDPLNPVRVRYYDTSNWNFDSNYRGAWGIYPFLPSGNILVSDMQEGLFILEGIDDQCDLKEESAIVCETTNATNDIALLKTEFRVFPQPTQYEVSVEMNSIEIGENIQTELRDLNGQILMTYPEFSFDGTMKNYTLPSLPAGIYLLSFKGQNWQRIEKVMVIK